LPQSAEGSLKLCIVAEQAADVLLGVHYQSDFCAKHLFKRVCISEQAADVLLGVHNQADFGAKHFFTRVCSNFQHCRHARVATEQLILNFPVSNRILARDHVQMNKCHRISLCAMFSAI
jgi:hypothetical protein